MDTPQLYQLNDDPGESIDLAAKHPEVVKQLLAVAERILEDIGDHDRVGKNMRFYDPMESRPTTPPTDFRRAKKKR